MLFPTLTLAPEDENTISKPISGTPPGYALELISAWAVTQAEARSNHPYRRFPLPASAFIKTSTCWQLAHLYGPKGRPTAWWDTLTIEQLADEVDLTSWLYQAECGNILVNRLKDITHEVFRQVISIRAQKKQARISKGMEKSTTTIPYPNSSEDTTLLEYNTQNRIRDNTLSRKVAFY
jgi:hypothetical protein